MLALTNCYFMLYSYLSKLAPILGTQFPSVFSPHLQLFYFWLFAHSSDFARSLAELRSFRIILLRTLCT